ncbi:MULTISPECIES: glycosyltransferase [unclassified Serratia (in: enterobacteria)]|uniref:glycosyltransferase n=1 Tax=unclassified Serratia (in: enterobacteria) TaxID=2647522 RepID=UPI0005036D62|nr:MULTISPECIES: glycosyltransferase [unclassified Serratia (in: enterobacteria)]KFK97883.1 hypothetical protein JV45_00890 [Serratia sp. Ag2]KFL00274.1 hypothetical protein IV04_02200 [Serratia sp. Ag1]
MNLTKNKNICFFLTDLSDPGGIQRVVVELANFMSKFNNVTIISVYANTMSKDNKPSYPYEISEKVRIIYLVEKNAYEKKLVKHINCLLKVVLFSIAAKKHKFDYIISQGMDSVIWSSTFAMISGAKYICCDHTSYFRKPLWARIGRKISLLLSHQVIVLTELDRRQWNSEKVVMIPNPIPVDDNLNIAPLSHRGKNIIAVGRLVEVKGFIRLLDIWKRVGDNGSSNNYNLKIIGEGPMRATLDKYIITNNIKHVTISGFTKEINDIYRHARLLLVTSFFEGFSMVLIEAMYYGVPAIAFDVHSGPREIIDNNKTGFLVEDGNTAKFVELLSSVLNNDVVLNSMSLNGRLKVNQYRISEVCNKWDKVMNALE